MSDKDKARSDSQLSMVTKRWPSLSEDTKLAITIAANSNVAAHATDGNADAGGASTARAQWESAVTEQMKKHPRDPATAMVRADEANPGLRQRMQDELSVVR